MQIQETWPRAARRASCLGSQPLSGASPGGRGQDPPALGSHPGPEGEALRIRQWKQVGDRVRSMRRTATSQFLFLRIMSALVRAATEAAALGFLEDLEPPTRKPEAPKPPGHCF